LKNVKILENINANLILKVEAAKAKFAPKEIDKTQLNATLDKVRKNLENEALDCVEQRILTEKYESISDHYNQRLQFFQAEGEIQKQKIHCLQNYLRDINSQREYLNRSTDVTHDDIEREKASALKSEKDLQILRDQLVKSRLSVKKSEFECQTILDQLTFLKAVFDEEINALKAHKNSLCSLNNGSDVIDFYRKELNSAIEQIRDDFKNLNNQQMAEYKKSKEKEIKELEKKIEAENKNKPTDIHSLNINELKSTRQANEKELNELRKHNSELNKKLNKLKRRLTDERIARDNGDLERLQIEIQDLKVKNSIYIKELDYWERVTREKLESEILTYKSILQTQINFFDSSKNDPNDLLPPPLPKPPRPAENTNISSEFNF
jgi:hypothetical protein